MRCFWCQYETQESFANEVLHHPANSKCKASIQREELDQYLFPWPLEATCQASRNCDDFLSMLLADVEEN